MEKKNLLTLTFASVVTLLAFGVIGIQSAAAVEKHHQPAAGAEAQAASESSRSGMMPMHGSGGGSQMMEMMGGADDDNGGGMMDMMDRGIMPMMMRHIMGGPGGMGKMMGHMKSCMQGRRGGPQGMLHILENLDLTPEQWEQVRTLAGERLDTMADLWAQRMKLQIELVGLRWDHEPDPQKVKDLFVKRAEAQADMFLTGMDYLRRLKGVLTPEQQKKVETQGF